MAQIQRTSGGAGDDGEEAGQVVRAGETSSADSLLDEIDGILETNAEEFVKSYVQKGGQ